LTTKFTQHTAGCRELSADDGFQLSVISSQLHHFAPCKLYSATLLLARLNTFTVAPTTDPSLRSGWLSG
jgi:hypothetical protein